MKLLEVLPDVALVTEIRFAANFQGLLLTNGAAMEIDDALFIVHTERQAIVTRNLKKVLCIVAELGKDCQVIRVDNSGAVESCK